MGKVKFIEVKVNSHCKKCCFYKPEYTQKCLDMACNGDECKTGKKGYYIMEDKKNG